MSKWSKQDAHSRVFSARCGSLECDCITDEYLTHLKRELYLWIERIDEQIAERIEAADKKRKALEA